MSLQLCPMYISHLCKGYIRISMHTYSKKLFVAYLIFKLNFSSCVLSFSGIHTQGCSDLASIRHTPQGYVIQSSFKNYHPYQPLTTLGSRSGCSPSDLPSPVKSMHTDWCMFNTVEQDRVTYFYTCRWRYWVSAEDKS